MKALIYNSFGDPSVLEWVEDWGRPTISKSQVLVRVVAGSVNPKDVLLRKGKFSRTLARDPLPRVSGLDITGEIVEIGKNVADFNLGDLVFGMTNHFSGGVHSEYAALEANCVARAPSNISPESSSSVPLCAQTALQALRDHCKIEPTCRKSLSGNSGKRRSPTHRKQTHNR